ncbi:MAG: Uma2 family endonuclease [Isosphaeraceae bacterium]
MSVTSPPLQSESAEPLMVIEGVSWDAYVALNDSIGERKNPRMIYCEGRLTLVTRSRRHEWYGERLSQMVVALADGLDIPWEDAGSTTYRRRKKKSGAEGDKTFYFATHAELMMGALDVDLEVQPPPDLAIEVEVSHSADDAMRVWGRLRVPEVWRYDPIAEEFGFWLRRQSGRYKQSQRGLAFPVLTAPDVVGQMRLADQLGAGAWHKRLPAWVREVIVPRQ